MLTEFYATGIFLVRFCQCLYWVDSWNFFFYWFKFQLNFFCFKLFCSFEFLNHRIFWIGSHIKLSWNQKICTTLKPSTTFPFPLFISLYILFVFFSFSRIKRRQKTELDIFLVSSLLEFTVGVIKAKLSSFMKVCVTKEILLLQSNKNHNFTCYLMCCWGVKELWSQSTQLICKDCK